MYELINCTPHAVCVAGRTYEPSGMVARVSSTHEVDETDFEDLWIFEQRFGEIQGLPEPKNHSRYIVSAMVLAAAKAAGRSDCLAPATGHPDVVRNDKGHIVSVPGFVK